MDGLAVLAAHWVVGRSRGQLAEHSARAGRFSAAALRRFETRLGGRVDESGDASAHRGGTRTVDSSRGAEFRRPDAQTGTRREYEVGCYDADAAGQAVCARCNCRWLEDCAAGEDGGVHRDALGTSDAEAWIRTGDAGAERQLGYFRRAEIAFRD